MWDFDELRVDLLKGGIAALSVTVIIMFVIGIIAGTHETFRIISSYTSCIRPEPEMIKHCAELAK